MRNILSLATLSLLSLKASAEPVVEHQPEFWTPVQTNVMNNDIPQYLGYLDNAPLKATYSPDAVGEGTLNMLHHAELFGNLILLSVVGVAILFAIFLAINGRAKLHHGFSGELVDRWTSGDVALHWLAAIPCVVLILSGVVIGAGRIWLEPIMTPSHYTGMMNFMVVLHNTLAWPFAIGAVWLLGKWFRKQLPEACDIKWFATLGGYINFGRFKGAHPDAGFANAGEKAFFWTFALFGIVLIVSGFVLFDPDFLSGLGKQAHNTALIAHIVGAIILGAFSVVHIYMGAVMSEGGLENMLSGKCDKNWAIQNHNLWYDEVYGEKKPVEGDVVEVAAEEATPSEAKADDAKGEALSVADEFEADKAQPAKA